MFERKAVIVVTGLVVINLLGCGVRQLSEYTTEVNHPDAATGEEKDASTTTGDGGMSGRDAAIDTGGLVVGNRALGASCTAAGDCTSGRCVDGVCCDGSCSGQCESCNEPNMAGHCAPVTGNPRGGRATCAGTAACKGACDGVEPARCRFPGDTTQCAPSSCAAGRVTTATSCNGAGACTMPVTMTCPSNLCADPIKCSGGCDATHPCTGGQYCDLASAICLPQKPAGGQCRGAAECTLGNCVDGVCCDGACTGQCESCNEPSNVGKCVAVTGAPRGARTACAGSVDTCRGTCDGTLRTACAFPTASTVCTPARCAGGSATAASVCTGTGACTTPATTACRSNQCADTTRCLDSCGAASPCGTSTYCDASGVCQPKKGNGTACAAGPECTTGNCVDGVCCASTCTGQCESCNEPSMAGTCVAVAGNPRGARTACAGTAPCRGQCNVADPTKCRFPAGETQCTPGSCSAGSATTATVCNGAGACTAPTTMMCASNLCADTIRCSGGCSATAPCPATQFCNSSAACVPKKAMAAACQADAECTSAHCVDGVCCDLACAGQCEACAEPNNVGRCVAVTTGQPRGSRTACVGTTCRGSCAAASRTACTYPGSATICTGATCMGAVGTTASVCNGMGGCTMATSSPCRANQCLNATTCLNACSATQPCAAGTFCDPNGICLIKKADGVACLSGAECVNNNCVDGVCCNVACGGKCQGCNEAGSAGRCMTIAGPPRGARGPCAGMTPCTGTCGGTDPAACTFPGGTCGTQTCMGTNVVRTGMCSGGACVLPGAAECAGGLICSANACLNTCNANAECLARFYCSPRPGGTCHLDGTRVAIGEGFKCVVLVDNTARCWGVNTVGQLGNNTTASSTVPTVVAPLSGATAIVAGQRHACALLTDRTVRCWGLNNNGQLGSGTPGSGARSLVPVQVSVIANVTSISAGENFTCALLSDGSVWCWGLNDMGQLGNGTTTSSVLPVRVGGATPLTGVTAMGVGVFHACAVVAGGQMRCWGYNFGGQIGNGTNLNALLPATVLTSALTPLTGATAVQGGSFHTCALLTGGAVKCWGLNGDGQLGTGGADTNVAPLGSALSSGAASVSSGGFGTCALMSGTGQVQCWGSVLMTASTVTAVGGLSGATAIAVNGQGCAILSDGSLGCWGPDSNGNFSASVLPDTVWD